MKIKTYPVPKNKDEVSTRYISDDCLLPEGICFRAMPWGEKVEECVFYQDHGFFGPVEWCRFGGREI